jgi:dTDP-4-dehydrorhamnose 3,5-epimerase-like enzyme
MEKVQKINFPTHVDERGALTVVEIKDYVDWPVARVYYLNDVTLPRGSHAVKGEKKMYVCQKGSCLARLHDGEKWHEFELKGPDDAILMSGMCYRDFQNFSKDAVLMAISSVNYNPDDYIYDFDEFLEYVKSKDN